MVSSGARRIAIGVFGAVLAGVAAAIHGFDFSWVMAGDEAAVRRLLSMIAVGAGTGLIGWVKKYLDDVTVSDLPQVIGTPAVPVVPTQPTPTDGDPTSEE